MAAVFAFSVLFIIAGMTYALKLIISGLFGKDDPVTNKAQTLAVNNRYAPTITVNNRQIPNLGEYHIDVAPGDEFRVLVLVDEDGNADTFDLNKPLPDGINIKEYR